MNHQFKGDSLQTHPRLFLIDGPAESLDFHGSNAAAPFFYFQLL